MNRETLESLAGELRRQRTALFEGVLEAEEGLAAFAAEREAEIEERAQEDRMARLLGRLDERGRREIEDIDAALQRIARGRYGTCTACGGTIPLARLRVVPASPFCIDCARNVPPLDGAAEEAPHRGPIPSDLSSLSERELESVLRERINQDRRIDSEELRVVCRHGVVYLDGALPAEAEHQILRQIVTDLAGLREVVDRIQINEVLWERAERSKATRRGAQSGIERTESEDVFESIEEGIGYVPPDAPTPEEE